MASRFNEISSSEERRSFREPLPQCAHSIGIKESDFLNGVRIFIYSQAVLSCAEKRDE